MKQEILDQFKREEDLARGVAGICGPHSAAGKALAELERRRAAGQRAVMFREGPRWIVGELPAESNARDPGAQS